MAYTIFELNSIPILTEVEEEGYYSSKYNNFTLKELKGNIKSEHNTHEEAEEEIISNKEHLKHKTLVILPTYSINWEGEIK